LAPHFYNLSERILELFEEEEMVDVLGDVGGSDLRGWLKHAYWPGWD
jgi:GINS complex subunit 3